VTDVDAARFAERPRPVRPCRTRADEERGVVIGAVELDLRAEDARRCARSFGTGNGALEDDHLRPAVGEGKSGPASHDPGADDRDPHGPSS
jgi:hypothetical protein